ncbi:hypothetical protein [Rhizobium phage RHph_X2_24]|nr:hypothetical protein [Rhizobium phage RHph_X2_24]
MKRIIAFIAIAVQLASCATPPEQIKAAQYDGKPCTIADVKRLNALTEEQARVARQDAMGVLIIGLPVASMGDNARSRTAEIATLKGRCR